MVAIFWAGATSAYSLFGADWTHLPGPREVRFVISAAGDGVPAGASATIRSAAALLNTNAIRIRFDPDRCLAEYPRVDNVNSIRFADISPGPLTDGHNNAYANRRNDLKRMQECDMVFHIARQWHAAAGPTAPTQHDLFSVALHEFGHCLGLDHSSVEGAVMSATLPVGRERRVLSSDDISGRQKIYGE